jgi:glycosyltransferase involved in cell wall biosynthesis
MNNNITVLTFSYNEERRISYFLEAVKNFAPVVVIDNFSTDATLEIAKQYTPRVEQFKNAGYAEHPDVANFALSQVTTEWVYWGRVDEIPPAPLLAKLAELASTGAHDVVMIARLNMLFGGAVKTWGDDYQIIFFRKTAIDLKRSALFEHGSFAPGSKVLHLPAVPEMALWHFSSYDVAAYTSTNNRYSSIAAREILARRNRPATYSTSPERTKRILKKAIGRFQETRGLGAIRVMVVPPLRFAWHYFVRGGIKSGWAGFVTSYLMMMEQMLIELKIWELEKGLTLEQINRHYDELKQVLISGQIPSSRNVLLGGGSAATEAKLPR